jgi:hypothetical protein
MQRKHADRIAEALMARCTDLKFKKDFSSGRWYDDKELLVWNTAIDSVAFVGMYPFKEKLELIFTPDVRMLSTLSSAPRSRGPTTSQGSSSTSSITTSSPASSRSATWSRALASTCLWPISTNPSRIYM